MANIKTTQEQWANAFEYKKAGLSLADISRRTGISKSRLGEELKEVKPDDETGRLIQDAVRVETAKRTISKRTRDVVNELVDEQTRHIQFFNEAALENVRQSLRAECTSQQDFRNRAETISKARTDVLGKTPEVQVNTQVNAQVNAITKIEQVIIKPQGHEYD